MSSKYTTCNVKLTVFVTQFKYIVYELFRQAVENDIVVTNQPGTEAVVIKQPQSNGHQRSFTIEDCSYIDEGNETFEEKKWKENGGASITINDVSGVKVERPDSTEGESTR